MVKSKSAWPSLWLIAKDENGCTEVLTIDKDSGEALPVFSFEEEAQMFLGHESLGDGWQARESGTGEVISVLYGPCAGVREVALDPLPEMVTEGTVGLVTLFRERFVALVLGRGKLRVPPARTKRRDGAAGARGATREASLASSPGRL